MAAAGDWIDDDFVPTERVADLDARGRYEYLLRVIRYWLARQMSFTEIEETLVGAGLAPVHAEQIVELVIQDLQGRVRAPGAFPDVDVPAAALEALGFSPRELAAADRRFKTPEPDPVPELAFAEPTDATAGAIARARGASRTFTVGAVVFVALCVLFALLLLLAA